MKKVIVWPAPDEDNLWNLASFLAVIKNDLNADEIYILHTKDLGHQIKGLPGGPKFFHIKEEQLGPLQSIKTAEALNEIFNVSLSLSFRKDMGSHLLNKSLKVKERIGFKQFKTDLLLTEKIDEQELIGKESLYHRFLVTYLKNLKLEVENLTPPLFWEGSEKLPENFFKEGNNEPFLFFAYNEMNEERLTILKNLAQSLTATRVFFWIEKEPESPLAEESFHYFKNVSEAPQSELYRYISLCRGHVTNLPWLALQASCQGKQGIIETSEEVYSQLDFAPYKVQQTFLDEKKGGTESTFIDFVLNEYKI